MIRLIAGLSACVLGLSLPNAAISREAPASPAYDACMVAAGGVTLAMRNCSAAEYRRLDHELNQRYTALMRTLPRGRARELRAAERQWLAERKRTCDRAGAEAEGGTLQLVLVDNCYVERLRERVAVLAAMQRR
jgi:uncharacterized protein YecT (DUF1311 family)